MAARNPSSKFAANLEQRQRSSKILSKQNIQDLQNSIHLRDSLDFFKKNLWQRNAYAALNDELLQANINLTP